MNGTCLPILQGEEPYSNQADSRRFESLSALDDIDDYGLPFAQSGEAGSFKGRDVDEYVLPAAIASNEAVALRDIEPLNDAGLLDWRV